jgi:Na+-driven multidrug efflux pump
MLGGLGLANALVNSLVLATTFGLSGVLETMVSQAYGSNQLYLCGTYLNK